MELAKSFDPRSIEGRWYAEWERSGLFEPTSERNHPAYCIQLPPPNVTGTLHMGHAFNQTIMDSLTRYHRMRGFNTLWVPGTDHAGIATQTVVERRLLQQGKRRSDFTRPQFIAKVQEWKDEYEATILSQLQAMGASCDYDRVRFTMDPVCAAAVRAARQAYKGPIVAVVQPHRYTRLRDTFEQFATCLNDADVAVIAPVYPAGEKPIEGINRDTYAEALRAHGHRNVITIEGEDDLAAVVAPYVKPGAAIIGTGAGSITSWMNNLPQILAKKLEGLA